MNSPPPVPKQRSKNFLPVCVLAAILTPALALLAAYVGFRMSNTTAVRRLEAKARQRGEPLTLAELAAKYPRIPDAENAAVPLMALWEKDDPVFWQAYRRGQEPLPEPWEPQVAPELPFLGRNASRVKRSEPLLPANRAAAEDYLKQQAERLQVVRLALRRPYCSFPTKITQGFNALLPYLSALRREAQNFRIAGAVAVDQGDVDGALSAFEDTRRTGDALAECPLLLDQLVRIGCLTMVLEDTQRLLSQQRLSPAQLQRLDLLFQSLRMPGAARSALIAERACCLSLFYLSPEPTARHSGNSDEGDRAGEGGAYQAGMGLLSVSGLAAMDRRLMLETMDEAITLAGEDSPAALEKYNRLFVRVGEQATRFPPKLFSATMLPSLQGVLSRFASFEARRRAAVTAVAVERYRLAHQGHLPESLEALVPEFLLELPADPFTGRPLCFRSLASGFVIYSVGPNRHDDGAKERPEKGHLKDYDETFIVER